MRIKLLVGRELLFILEYVNKIYSSVIVRFKILLWLYGSEQFLEGFREMSPWSFSI